MAKGRIEQEILVKIVGGEDIAVLEKQIKALQKTKAEVVVTAETGDTEKKLAEIDKQIADLEGEKAEIEVKAKVALALAALGEVADEAKRAEAAADALSAALGPELAGQADLDGIIGDFQRMGLSLDEITAHADLLGGKLREVGQRDVGGKLATGFLRIDASARSASNSASILSTTFGNAAQDIGQLAGLSGSAGVAVSQLGDQMANAALTGGSLLSVMKNFAVVAGPVAVLVAAVQAVNSVVAAHEQAAEDSAAATEQLGDALEGASDQAVALAANLQPVVDRLQEVDRSGTGFWTDFVTGVQGAAGAIPGLGAALGAVGVDVTDMIDRVSDIMPTLRKIGIDSFELAQSIAGSHPIYEELNAAYQAGTITAKEYAAAVAGIAAEEKLLQDLREDDEFFDVGIKQLKAMQIAADRASDPLDHYKEQWDVLRADLRDGRWDTQASAQAINTLSLALGLNADQIRAIAWDEYIDGQKTAKEATEEATKAAEEWGEKLQEVATEVAVDLAEAQTALTDMSSVFNEMSRREGAIKAAFELGNAPLEFLGDIRDIDDAIRGLGEFIEEEGLPDIFDPNDVDAGPFLDKIASLRGPIQQQISNAFATGGPVAARQTAEAYVRQITESMRGKLTSEEVATLLGLGDLEATLKIAVDQESLREAQDTLKILTGLTGVTPYSAEIALALATGELTPQAAQILIAKQLEGVGVDVPANLLPPDQASRDAALAEANRWAAEPGHQVDMESNVNDPKLRSLIEARVAGEEYAEDHPIRWPVEIQPPRRNVFADFFRNLFDQGGTVNGIGGIAGERGPELLNGRYLTTGPTYVPPGTKVTSRRQTRVIMRQHPPRNLKRYDAGGIVPSAPITVNFNGVGTIGNRADVDRQVRRSMQRIERIYGSRA